jgi:hypothetical protein
MVTGRVISTGQSAAVCPSLMQIGGDVHSGDAIGVQI